MSLAQTIKRVSDLNQLVRHRDKLETYYGQLEKFEVKRRDEDLDDRSSYYAGCKIELRDDASNIFTMRNPVIISEIVDFMKTRFLAKQIELEAKIKWPA